MLRHVKVVCCLSCPKTYNFYANIITLVAIFSQRFLLGYLIHLAVRIFSRKTFFFQQFPITRDNSENFRKKKTKFVTSSDKRHSITTTKQN